jgi:hypothetical protein
VTNIYLSGDALHCAFGVFEGSQRPREFQEHPAP